MLRKFNTRSSSGTEPCPSALQHAQASNPSARAHVPYVLSTSCRSSKITYCSSKPAKFSRNHEHGRIRTCDTQNRNLVLYPLSYAPSLRLG